jgi:hypothetical protein
MQEAKPVVHELKKLPSDAHPFAQVAVRHPLTHVRMSFPTLSAHVPNPLAQNEQVTATALREIPTPPITTAHNNAPINRARKGTAIFLVVFRFLVIVVCNPPFLYFQGHRR